MVHIPPSEAIWYLLVIVHDALLTYVRIFLFTAVPLYPGISEQGSFRKLSREGGQYIHVYIYTHNIYMQCTGVMGRVWEEDVVVTGGCKAGVMGREGVGGGCTVTGGCKAGVMGREGMGGGCTVTGGCKAGVMGREGMGGGCTVTGGCKAGVMGREGMGGGCTVTGGCKAGVMGREVWEEDVQ